MFNKTLTAIALAAAVVASAASAQAETLNISPDYKKQLSGWLESHKHYPDSARQQGEQGSVNLRFRVGRNGQVLDYTVVGSSGFADLDQSVKTMMHDAVLPSFPPSMTSPDIDVSVNINFKLTPAVAGPVYVPPPRAVAPPIDQLPGPDDRYWVSPFGGGAWVDQFQWCALNHILPSDCY